MVSSRLVTCLAAVLLTAGAAEARTNWQGEAFIVAVNQACIDDGWSVGDNFLVTFRPANIDDNGAASFLAFIGRRTAYSMRVTSGAINSGDAYNAVAIGSTGNYYTYQGLVSAFTATPYTQTTVTVSLTGRFTNWGGTPNCVATIRAALTRRP